MPLRHEIKSVTRLALPVVLAQAGSMTMGLVDTAMVGRLSSEALSAVALGDVIAFGTLIAGIGIIMGIDPIVSQAHGAGRGAAAGLALQRGMVLAVLLNIPLGFAWFHTEELLTLLGQSPDLARDAQTYAEVQIFSIGPFLVFQALRQYLQGRAIMVAPLLIIISANVMNVLFNWTLIFGNLGFPALGIEGAGIATGLTRVYMMLAMIAVVFGWKLHLPAWQPWSRQAFSPGGLWEVLRHGLPVAAMHCLEIWTFTLSSIFAGWLEPRDLNVAAHTIVLKIASFSFMFPFGVSMACATRVGNLLGAGRRDEAQHAAWAGLTIGAGAMLAFAGTFLALRHQLPKIFVTDAEEVVALAALILPIAAAFQLFDGTQAVASGILRGMGKTLPASLFNLAGFYGVGLPAALWLTFPEKFGRAGDGIGLAGIWWGLCVGLGVVAALQLLWVWKRGPRTVRKLAIDSPNSD